MTEDGLFAHVVELPDDAARKRFDSLIGLEDVKRRLIGQARVLLDPTLLESWSKKAYDAVIPAVEDVLARTPLILLGGDVGTGKTEIAETVGDAVGRSLKTRITLFSLSLSARGQGAVGEMTTLITNAFARIHEHSKGGRDRNGALRHGTILLVDEGDALAQSRELAQMHHEDRAGVNALIRGIDEMRVQNLPVLTIMCSNRVSAIDPAIRRRAADVLNLTRPNDAQRKELLGRSFAGASIAEKDIDEVVRLTGPTGTREYGCTYSDLRQRLVPSVVIEAMQEATPLSGTRLVALAREFEPTRPFEAESGAHDG